MASSAGRCASDSICLVNLSEPIFSAPCKMHEVMPLETGQLGRSLFITSWPWRSLFCATAVEQACTVGSSQSPRHLACNTTHAAGVEVATRSRAH